MSVPRAASTVARNPEQAEGEQVRNSRETFATVAEVRAEVDRIILSGNRDIETQHEDEDQVCERFARSVARGTADDPVGMAREIERMLAAELDRWYA